ncbi:MAG: anaerobic ribonucleoside-triphosphate reductase activating protein [Clostridia bacterium]|nr:anaerobic ribonucleoside-triphosphate reductase activating protein [Clostridia bacterium]
MNYATIKRRDVSNGPGVRVSLYVSGCRNHCKNCFNPETWDFCYGEPFTEQTENAIIEDMKPDYIKGFTLLGGDPFEPENAEVLAPFLERLRKKYPQKSFWCFTGYDYEADLLTGRKGDIDTVMRILKCLDVLVDGKFVEELKDLNLRFRGSSNQRIILVKPSLESDEVVLWDEQTII